MGQPDGGGQNFLAAVIGVVILAVMGYFCAKNMGLR